MFDLVILQTNRIRFCSKIHTKAVDIYIVHKKDGYEIRRFEFSEYLDKFYLNLFIYLN
jgi:hypothetical protein